MFSRLFGRSKPPRLSVRETLFGDMPIDRWLDGPPLDVFPWSAFASARDHLRSADTASAVREWRRVVATPELEPRHHLQAWHYLRKSGEQPDAAIAKHVLGVVVEVGMPDGVDLVAAYANHSARCYNFSGAGVVWERPDNSLDPLIDRLLSEAARVVSGLAPWWRARLPAPLAGVARVSILTSSGIHFGEGPMDVLASDPLGRGVVQIAAELMQALISVSQRP